jgi:hypothetical protein
MPRKKALVAKELNTRQAKAAKETREAAQHAAAHALAKELKLRPKTKAFVDLLQSNPKLSQTQAYIDTHMTVNRNAASVEAAKLLAKPSVRIYSNNAVLRAKKKIVTLIDSEQENIALRASESVLDRQFGKATFKSESVAKTVEVKLDLTGVKIGTHYLPSVAQ